MGRTLPSAAQVFQMEEKAYASFRAALKPIDRRALDELFNFAHMHTAEVAYAAHDTPMEVYLICMLIEQHKIIMKLRVMVEELTGKKLDPKPVPPDQLF